MSNSRIKLLDKSIIETIVSGEVIGGVSCVLKELLENSVDAGSSKIVIYIEKMSC